MKWLALAFVRTSSLRNVGVSTMTGTSRKAEGISVREAGTNEPSFVVLSLMTPYAPNDPDAETRVTVTQPVA